MTGIERKPVLGCASGVGREDRMSLDPITLDLARIAHTLWCRRMTQEGWNAGPTYDPVLKTHDALVPFDRLKAADRRNAVNFVVAEDLEQRIARGMDVPRGPEREFTTEDMRVGLQVGWADDVSLADQSRDPRTEIGTVESWETVGEQLVLIRVRWPGGELLEHIPVEQELRRIE
jgi:hypothetical protein